ARGRPLRCLLFPYTTLFRSQPRMCTAARTICVAADGDPILVGPPTNGSQHGSRTAASMAGASLGLGEELVEPPADVRCQRLIEGDRKSTRLNSSHEWISYAV